MKTRRRHGLAIACVLALAQAAVAQDTETPAQHFAAIRARLAEDTRARLRSDDLLDLDRDDEIAKSIARSGELIRVV